MKKVIITDLLILAVFGSTCFWSVKKERLTASVDKILTEQASEDEEILVLTANDLRKEKEQEKREGYIKWAELTVSKLALSESY